MKTTLELPDALMQRVKLRAVHRNQKLALTSEQGKKLLADAESRMQMLTSLPHAQALETAAHFGISAYDARFIALAKRLGVELITEDAKLRAAVPSLTLSLAHAIA